MIRASRVEEDRAALDRGSNEKMAATIAIAKVDADHLTWQSTNRSLDGKAIPDSAVVKMKRAK